VNNQYRNNGQLPLLPEGVFYDKFGNTVNGNGYPVILNPINNGGQNNYMNQNNYNNGGQPYQQSQQNYDSRMLNNQCGVNNKPLYNDGGNMFNGNRNTSNTRDDNQQFVSGKFSKRRRDKIVKEFNTVNECVQYVNTYKPTVMQLVNDVFICQMINVDDSDVNDVESMILLSKFIGEEKGILKPTISIYKTKTLINGTLDEIITDVLNKYLIPYEVRIDSFKSDKAGLDDIVNKMSDSFKSAYSTALSKIDYIKRNYEVFKKSSKDSQMKIIPKTIAVMIIKNTDLINELMQVGEVSLDFPSNSLLHKQMFLNNVSDNDRVFISSLNGNTYEVIDGKVKRI